MPKFPPPGVDGAGVPRPCGVGVIGAGLYGVCCPGDEYDICGCIGVP